MRIGPLIVSMTIELDGQCEIRFTTSGKMVCRIYPKMQPTGMHHVFTYWCNNKDDEDSAARLSELPSGTPIIITGHAKTKTLTNQDGGQESYRAFTVTEWKEA